MRPSAHESAKAAAVRVHEVVLDQQQMFLVMELVEYDLGHAASQEPWLRPSLSHPSLRLSAGLLIEHMRTPFGEAQAKCLCMQLLSALAAVHATFTLHRDLKRRHT